LWKKEYINFIQEVLEKIKTLSNSQQLFKVLKREKN
jgi:hypothetical protein